MVVIYRIRHSEPGKRFGTAPAIHLADAYGNNPVVSPVDGRVLDSRHALREHNRRNDVEDVGNDEAVLRPKEFVDPAADLAQDLSDTYDKIEQGEEGVQRILRRSDHG